MDERREDPASAKKMKKLEKPQTPANREYLDMDTDEEEFGRPETPEPEEESELEPEKPVFTADELNTLVRYIKDSTTLSSLTEADWSREVVDTVEEYFCSPANTVLTIYWEAAILKALLDFPPGIGGGLTYFLRAPWQVYTPDNFLSTIIFGSIGGGVDNSTLKFMENMYAPIAFHSSQWPAVVRNELFSNLHEFLLSLTDVTYNPMGLTILYVPREGLKEDGNGSEINDESRSLEAITEAISETRDEKEEGLLERLERVARYWIRQIREALKGTSSSTLSSPWKTIVDEIRYWRYRYENLSCLHRQLTNKNVLSIVQKLESVRSSSVQQYNPLVVEVQRILDEAISNIEYLNLLEDFSKGFEISVDIEDYAVRVLLLVRFVGTESPFYNTSERIESLCRSFCVQAVLDLSRKFIDLDIVLNGDADAGRKLLVECIESCDKLSSTYDRLADMDKTSDSPTISLADKIKVFNHVDTLMHRCDDLIGIADARIAFDKCDEPITICGPKGFELGLRYRNIEKRFNVALREIKNARDIILDIASAAWLDRIVAFKRDLKDIENMVKNWIDDIFEDVLNVEDGIEALHGIARFSRRPYLRDTLNNKWIQMWKMFRDELDSCSTGTSMGSILRHPSVPPFSGQANILRSSKVYLARQHRTLVDASDWFGDCDVQSSVTRKYKRVLAAISERETQLFVEWQKNIADKKMNTTDVSNQPVIKYHSNTKAITINLQMSYFDNIREIGEWTLLTYDAKNIFSKVRPKGETLRSRYNKVEHLCKCYNIIIATETDCERLLFATLLDDLEETLSSGFKRVTWSSDSFERFFTECMEILIKIQESFEGYRNIDWKVDRKIERIAVTSLVNTDNDLPIETLEDCETHLDQERCNAVMIIENNSKGILKLLLEFKSRMNIDEAKRAKHWTEYVNRIHKRLNNSFANCVRLSLLRALQFLRDVEPLMKIDAFSSKVQQAERAIARINASALKNALPTEEFKELFGTTSDDEIMIFLNLVDQDPESIVLRREIKSLLQFTE